MRGLADIRRFTDRRLVKLLAFLRENHWVLVTPAANGMAACQCCGQMALAASEIKHAGECVVFAPRAATRKARTLREAGDER